MTLQDLTLAGGCFWCVEAVYLRVPGVEKVVSGYMGGTTENPTYEQICQGNTDHAEVIRITFDPEKAAVKQLLEIFFTVHDPTTLNRQGNDVGTQYRSAIFYADDEQKHIAEEAMKSAQEKHTDPIVTQIVPKERFWPAEEYHQDYFNRNPGNGYCQFAIPPKLEKLKKLGYGE
ncbi:MAG: peptide-methionine (S)-S-oxide reductase [Verrucomicrobiales bacterium]|nr:peptide-methionine (S)-S-oxide reductase [Verrucomicrobiales bacterium]|tara:strand:- start:2656 stop:3177 length:522 start_codon:yes stop_codon:yes gene_type:complete